MREWVRRNVIFVVIAGFVLLLTFQGVQSSQTQARMKRDEHQSKVDACNAVADGDDALSTLLHSVLPKDKDSQAFLANLDASFSETQANCLAKA